ncbi:hypothetical protein DW646_21540 [Bacteroides sp. AM23-18]|uniref:Uncharacterized protein n=1 Tax=Phocaeicola dorei DSM 17855 TaxID=483217 RepID=B6VT08_9BACT|nr:MAG: hypothetical protein EL88_18300 [Phocaeicola dorei]EEB26893.1 hypothetical protein BACDOR_00579 [Phocaeicola dorei DSM 17855]RGD23169.1 hypothetical protein DW646_21540 [Bacteroides sp. AM23-18]RJX06597.1 hypothetical protein DWW74_06940 [Bacteroides sp. AF17-1]
MLFIKFKFGSFCAGKCMRKDIDRLLQLIIRLSVLCIYQFGKCFYSFGIVFASIIPFDFYNFAALNLILI